MLPTSSRYRLVDGDLLAHPGPQVVPVNCVPGVMGAGLAKAYADRYKGLKRFHRRAVNDLMLAPRQAVIAHAFGCHPLILFPTKSHWKYGSSLLTVSGGLQSLGWKIESDSCFPNPCNIGFPALGCGLGGLSFDDVEPMIREFAEGLPAGMSVTVYRPTGRPTPKIR